MKTRRFTTDSRSVVRSVRHVHKPGFALIVTLSLMILLTVVAVGLLSLASISLRASSQSGAMSTARANARMALMLAIGDLQKNAGPDQRITARADVDASNTANPRLTGVWKSWDIKATTPPSPADYENAERDKTFVGWLASSTDGKASNQIGFAKAAPASPATLWGKGSLGNTASAADLVTAAKVPTLPSRGAFAWAVMDEGVKVRINTPYVDGATTKGMQTAQLGSGERPNVSSIPTLAGLKSGFFEQDSPDYSTVKKGITPLSFELAAERLAPGTGNLLKPLTHDVTSSSVGVLTDTATGGLKEDFNLLTNATTLPAPYSGVGTGVYATRLGMTAASAPSDPRWESFRNFAQIYRDSTRLTASGGLPVLKAQAPGGWNAASTGANPTINRTPPAGLVMLPTIAKVQVMFSLVGRDLYNNLPSNITGPLTAAQKAAGLHGPQDGHFRNTRYDYDLQLISTPMVTLHNPYNVALEFSRLRVEFIHVPFAMKVFRNGVAQSTDFVPLETMYGDNRDGSKDKIYGLNIKTKNSNGTAGVTTFKMLPGEVKLFSPYIDPNRTYAAEHSSAKQSWDIYVNDGMTTNIDAIPGWRGNGIGFSCDNLTGGRPLPAAYQPGAAQAGLWESALGLAWDDQIAVEFIPMNIPRANNKFIVTMSAVVGSPTNPSTVVSAIEMDYEKPDGLTEFIGGNGAKFPMRYPKADDVPNYVTADKLVERASKPIGSLAKVKPFALLSVQAKSTSGGRDAENVDGRLATKPWSFAHAGIAASTQKVISEHSANFSHEIDLQGLNGISDNFFSYDPQDRGNFISGNASFNGVKFGTMYDIPLTPLQTLVSLNGANPGGSSVYLPRFAQPVGNSWAHPMLDTAEIVRTKTGGNLLDHSFLLNLALYDHFYFSGLADQTGSFGTSGKTVSSLVTDFTAGKPLVDPRLTLYAPDGRNASALASEVSGTSPHTKIAAWQMMNGAFNINSTSVAAWKAMLGSIHDSQSYLNKINKTGNTSAFAKLPVTNTAGNESRISPIRLPASESEADGADPKDAYWLGPREYSDAQLQTLAEKIVEQVRARGPFLSMSEFVNRRLGPASDEKSQRGALQQAIDNSNLNQSLATGDANAGFEIAESAVANYKYANPKAGAGSSYQGAPGYLSQADLLAVLGNAATPRSDTFTIRGYGEARDAADKITATAVCEAVVQRVPDFVDSADKADTALASLTSPTNKTFGRRFQLVSFRWLGASEI